MNMKNTYFRHYKGGYYELLDVATHSETMEEMIVYKSVCENPDEEKTWVRPALMWKGLVNDGNGNPVHRFSEVTDIEMGLALNDPYSNT